MRFTVSSMASKQMARNIPHIKTSIAGFISTILAVIKLPADPLHLGFFCVHAGVLAILQPMFMHTEQSEISIYESSSFINWRKTLAQFWTIPYTTNFFVLRTMARSLANTEFLWCHIFRPRKKFRSLVCSPERVPCGMQIVPVQINQQN